MLLLAIPLLLMVGCEFSKDRGVRKPPPPSPLELKTVYLEAVEKAAGKFASLDARPEIVADAVLAECEGEFGAMKAAYMNESMARGTVTGEHWEMRRANAERFMSEEREKARREAIRIILIAREKPPAAVK